MNFFKKKAVSEERCSFFRISKSDDLSHESRIVFDEGNLYNSSGTYMLHQVKGW